MSEWLTQLVPDELLDAPGEIGRRARNLVALALILGPSHLLAAGLSIWMRGPNPLGFIVLAGAVGVFLTPVLVRVTRRIDLPALWLLGVIFLNVSASAWLGYGFVSPALHVFIIFPILGMALAGGRVGMGMAALTVGQLTLLFAALSVGYVFPLEANGHAYILFHFLCQAAAIVVTTAIMSTYDGAWRVAEAQSNAARDEVLAANDAKSTFLAHMSHELRTPLNAVLGYVELIQEDARDDQMADLARVRDAGGHLLALVDEVLDLARIEAGHIEMQPERLELHELMQSAIDEVHPLTQQHHTTCTLEGASVAAMGDRVRVRQVALNLLSNAAKFTVEGSIEVSVERRGRLVEVAVTDTGPGMTAEEVLRCFEPFEQGEAGRGQGTGLGLVISRRLCEAMGGQLTATSEVGVGTVFRMTLPYCP